LGLVLHFSECHKPLQYGGPEGRASIAGLPVLISRRDPSLARALPGPGPLAGPDRRRAVVAPENGAPLFGLAAMLAAFSGLAPQPLCSVGALSALCGGVTWRRLRECQGR